ncbi:hypothetical protein BDN71DRAFT_1377900, partial [Pleurotus eryngii]
STLQRLKHGGKSMSTFNVSKQLLSSAKEKVLVNLILESADHGIPLTCNNIHDYVDTIIKKHNGEGSSSGVGVNWVDRFIQHH